MNKFELTIQASSTPSADRQKLIDSAELSLNLPERHDPRKSADEEITAAGPAPFSLTTAIRKGYSELFTNIVSRLSKTMRYGQTVLPAAIFFSKVEKRALPLWLSAHHNVYQNGNKQEKNYGRKKRI